jgi:hypothetical protein
MSCGIRVCRARPISRRSPYVLFLKMDEERAGLAASGLIKDAGSALPEDCRWAILRDLQGEELTRRYSAIIDQLSRLSGVVGTTFLKAQNEIQDPAKPRRLVGLIDGETWLGLGVATSKARSMRACLNAMRRRSSRVPGNIHAACADRRDGDGGRSRAAGKRSTTPPAAPAAFWSRPGSTCAKPGGGALDRFRKVALSLLPG